MTFASSVVTVSHSTYPTQREIRIKKKKAERRRNKRSEKKNTPQGNMSQSNRDGENESDYEIDYVPEAIGELYSDLVEKFVPVDQVESVQSTEYSAEMQNILDADAQRRAVEAAESMIMDEASRISNKQKRFANRISIAALKASVERPDLVDGMDNCSPDPSLLLACKGYRNVIQVPRHWSNKRNYLSNKRGIDKQPFKLPEYVEQTGIAKIRQAVLAKEAEKDIKAKQRAKMRPKTGKLDIDYQVLYNAFFKYQTKPAFLTRFGDIYYEGREAETKYVHKKPGQISPHLREALGMLEGSPPPWLINMQRFGPPPSYPNLKIPGLNSPIPLGAEWGYHPGGWGKPPVDEFGNPIYGGAWNPERDRAAIVDLGELTMRQGLWGEFIEEESEDEDEEVTDVIPTAKPVTSMPVQQVPPVFSQGVAVTLFPQTSPQTVPPPPSSVPSSQSLYRVLPQVSAPTQPGALFPSRNVYEVVPESDPTGGIATAAGIASRANEVENEDIMTAEMIRKQLEKHEAMAASKADGSKKPAKKKQKFKF
jgi:splicing factor 3B subunit 2